MRPSLIVDPTTVAVPLATLVLLHGFTREPQNHADLAEDLAGNGFRVVLPDYPSLLAGEAARDRAVAIAVATVEAESGRDGPVVLAGFSAGAAIAVEAAVRLAERETALDALILLDPVPWKRTLQVAARVPRDLPVLALLAPPSPCNAEGSGRMLMNELDPGTDVRLVEGATHCDFEQPSDGLCRLVCGRDAPERRAAIEIALRDWLIDRIGAETSLGSPSR